jgi:hypothetical integral membrane protein (TIGR02206 family)
MYYGYFAVHGERMFPNHVPLELCDASLFLVVIALLTLNSLAFDLAYYFALAGASMSLLTPNLPDPSPLYLTIQYFADHGLLVTAVLYLVWSCQARPSPWSIARALLAVNVFAALVGAFDFAFHTDYMFLRAKPQAGTLLTILGPWPWYILACEPVALLLFLLLYLPFRRSAPNAS